VRVWIDLSNSPHPLLFEPVAQRLEIGGHEVLITARDNAQTVELARQRWSDTKVIGGHSPRGKRAKLAAISRRIRDLRRWAASVRPHVALSHNSYAQVVAARSSRIPVVTAMDFEHQPANHLAFRLANTILLPEVLPVHSLRLQGARPRKVITYPGLKEELYIGEFRPDADILVKLGLQLRPRLVVVVRTPPSRAVYHPSSNPLFKAALRTICAQEDVACVTLARHPEQIAGIDAMGLANCIVPRTAVDSRSLIYAADAFIGAGGTMTREAALMGIPTWTMFAGATPAVDSWLERQGLMSRLTGPEQLARIGPRRTDPRGPAELRNRSEAIAHIFIDSTLAAAGQRHRWLQPTPTARPA
jgi:uncharacterized protein